MKIISKARLRFTEGNSDKVYEVDLCERPEKADKRFVVNFRYGRFDARLRESSKTASPVTLEQAQKIYDSLVVSKVNKGYQHADAQPAEQPPTPVEAKPAPESAKVSIVEKTIIGYLHNPPKHWRLSRIVHRAGVLKLTGAADPIADLYNTGSRQLDYAIAWSLGRCGNGGHLSIINKMRDSRDEVLQRTAFDSYLQLANEADKQVEFERLKAQLTADIRQCIDDNNAELLASHLRTGKASRSKHNVALLGNIYALALAYPCCHQALLSVLATSPFAQQNHFKAYRHIFKTAEFRLDGPMFAVITLQIEQSETGEYNQPFKRATRLYLRRRCWRTLRQLGEANDGDYVAMASHVLLSITDSITGDDRFTGYLVFHHILFEHSNQFKLTTGRHAWARVSMQADQHRTEAFKSLWDQHPDALIHLLLNSQCRLVHQFALKVLTDNQPFCEALEVNVIAQLLASPYQQTSDFALVQVKRIYTPNAPDLALLAACLSSCNQHARELAMLWIGQQPAMLTGAPALVATIVLSPPAVVRQWGCGLIENIKFDDSQKTTVLKHLVSLVQTTDSKILADSMADTFVVLRQHFAAQLHALDFALIVVLLSHSNVEVQCFGATLLLDNQQPIEQIPGTIYNKISTSPSEKLQGIGVELLGKFSDAELLKIQDRLLAFCLSEITPVRQAVTSLVKRLAAIELSFGDAVFKLMVDVLFKAEPFEGLHADSLLLVESSLQPQIRSVDKQLCWRLTQAQSKAAQQLGAACLAHIAPEQFSVKQWALFGNNSTHAVRSWAMAAYQNNTDQIKANPKDGLRLLNSHWDESRDFAIDFFSEQFDKEDWTAEVIIGVCDNIQDDVQRFGRRLITEFFEDGDGVEYLTKLSQHPSRNVQLFTTNYLAAYATDNLERLQLLRPYFVTVLSSVRQGRIAKDRVMLFLLDEALKSEAVAGFVGELFDRQSLTFSIIDKAAYIEGMCAIKQKYPQQSLPIHVKPLTVKSKAKGEAHGV